MYIHRVHNVVLYTISVHSLNVCLFYVIGSAAGKTISEMSLAIVDSPKNFVSDLAPKLMVGKRPYRSANA